MNRYLTVIIVFIFCLSTSAQQSTLPLGKTYNNLYENKLHSTNSNIHTGFKPLIKSDVLKEVDIDSVINRVHKKFHQGILKRKLFSEHLFTKNGDDFKFLFNPVIHLEKGIEKEENKETFVNTRGFILEGNVGKNIFFFSSFVENQSIFSNYIHEYVYKKRVVPGQGYVKEFKGTGFDYAMSSGHLAIKPAKQFVILFGHGKHFIGDGYRSLLLSDNAFNYPFLRIQTTFWKVKYTNLYAEMQDLNHYESSNVNNYDYMGYAKKYMSSHHLSINITKKLNVSLYEAIIWRTRYYAPGNKGFDVNYLNPITLLRPIEFSLNSPDNVLAGLHTKYKLSFKTYFYGQLVLDEFTLDEMKNNNGYWANKFGYQLGAKMYDAFKFDNLILQAEYNFVRPYTYSHDNPLQNYAHYNQSLAHPIGANFSEKLVIINYRKERWVARAQLMLAKYGGKIKGDPTSYGNDIYMSYSDRPSNYGIEMYQGNLTTIDYLQLNIGYIINPLTNLKVDFCLVKRNFVNEIDEINTIFYSIGLKTDLFNRYYDF